MSMDLFLDKAQLLQSKVLTMIFINYRHSEILVNFSTLKYKKIVYYKLDPVDLSTVNYKCFRETKQGKYDATTFS